MSWLVGLGPACFVVRLGCDTGDGDRILDAPCKGPANPLFIHSVGERRSFDLAERLRR